MKKRVKQYFLDATQAEKKIYAVTRVGVEISVHIQIIIPLNASFF